MKMLTLRIELAGLVSIATIIAAPSALSCTVCIPYSQNHSSKSFAAIVQGVVQKSYIKDGRREAVIAVTQVVQGKYERKNIVFLTASNILSCCMPVLPGPSLKKGKVVILYLEKDSESEPELWSIRWSDVDFYKSYSRSSAAALGPYDTSEV